MTRTYYLGPPLRDTPIRGRCDPPKMIATYILRCGDGSYYVGSARDLERRMDQHYSGRGGDYTRKRMPVRLVWYRESDRIDEAYTLEKKIQNWSRAKREALIEGRFGDLPALSRKRFSKRVD